MNPYASMMGGLNLAEATNPLNTFDADALIAEAIRRKREEEQRRQLMQPQSPIAAAVMQPAPQPATTGVFGGGPNRFAQQEDLIEQMRANVADARRMNAAPPAPVDPSSPAWDFVQRQARGLSQTQQSPLGAALTQGPAAAPDPNKLENVIAGYLQRNPQGTDYKSFSVKGDGGGGLDFTQKNRLRQGDVAPRKVNSVAGDATRQQGRSARLDERQQNRVALGEERRKEGQQSALMASLMADPRSAAAFMGLQGDLYTSTQEAEAEKAAQHAQLLSAPWLIGVQNGGMTPEAAQKGIAGVLGNPAGTGQANVTDAAKPGLTDPAMSLDTVASTLDSLFTAPLSGESAAERQLRLMKIEELRQRYQALTGQPYPMPDRTGLATSDQPWYERWGNE